MQTMTAYIVVELSMIMVRIVCPESLVCPETLGISTFPSCFLSGIDIQSQWRPYFESLLPSRCSP